MPITTELENVKKFESVGFTHEQAEVLAETHESAVKAHDESLKEYMEHKFENMELKINGQLMLLKWMMGFILAGIVSLVLKAFFV